MFMQDICIPEALGSNFGWVTSYPLTVFMGFLSAFFLKSFPTPIS